MATLASLRSTITPHVPGAATFTIDEQLLLACRDFCNKTHVYRYSTTPIPVRNGIADYVISVPVENEIAWFNSVIQGAHAVLPVHEDQLNMMNPAYAANGGALASQYIVPVLGTIRLIPTPQGSVFDPLVINVALRPTMTALNVWDGLAFEHGETIMHGCLARLLSRPNEKWTNPEYAAYHAREYKIGIGEARRNINMGYSQSNSTMHAGASFI